MPDFGYTTICFEQLAVPMFVAKRVPEPMDTLTVASTAIIGLSRISLLPPTAPSAGSVDTSTLFPLQWLVATAVSVYKSIAHAAVPPETQTVIAAVPGSSIAACSPPPPVSKRIKNRMMARIESSSLHPDIAVMIPARITPTELYRIVLKTFSTPTSWPALALLDDGPLWRECPSKIKSEQLFTHVVYANGVIQQRRRDDFALPSENRSTIISLFLQSRPLQNDSIFRPNLILPVKSILRNPCNLLDNPENNHHTTSPMSLVG